MQTVSQTTPPSESTRAKSGINESKLPETKQTSKATPSTESGDSPAQQLVQRIIHEHIEVNQHYHTYKTISGTTPADLDAKLACGRKISELIVQHAGREECILYPAMKLIPELGEVSEKEVNKAIEEHQLVTNDLYKLLQMTKADHEYDQLLCKIMKELIEHIQDEEKRILPLFVNSCSKYDAAKVKHDYETVTVTTLPHPSAPREGTAAKIAHMASVPLDEAKKATMK